MEKEKSIIETVLDYSKTQRIGILLFFIICIILQGFYFFYDFRSIKKTDKEQLAWLSKQAIVDSLKIQKTNSKPVIYPFNPNFISDFKGYKLGMSTIQIDRLLAFRKQNKFVNSAADFQEVTGVSDSLLKTISPYFKFPDWVNNPKKTYKSFDKSTVTRAGSITVSDINQATKEDLMKVYGIGDKLSDRILTEKEKLGGFVSMEQLQDIWGLSPEVIAKMTASFVVKSTPNLKKIKINTASVKELAQFPFFNYALAKEIVIHRSMNGDIKAEDLSKIKGFPVDKIKIIALYLEF